MLKCLNDLRIKIMLRYKRYSLKRYWALLAFRKNAKLYPIVGRGHSGGRLVCEAYIKNGIPMGLVHNVRKDTFFFGENPDILKLILNAGKYQESNYLGEIYPKYKLLSSVHRYYLEEIRNEVPFGWKLGLTAFITPLTLDTFPNSKVLHIIHDGRDVMLSRLNVRMPDSNYPQIFMPLNRFTMFGDKNTEDYKGHPLTSETVNKFRNELEMLHWVTAVRYGMLGREYENRYLEIKYEDICTNPIESFSKIFDFIIVPFLETTKEWLKENAQSDRIGKWKNLTEEEMKAPMEIGGGLLKELGYIS